MTKNNTNPKQKLLTDEDIKIIKSDPVGLADYIVCTKVKEAKKTAFIVCLIMMALAFGAGVFVGMTWTKTSIPNNVVKIQVGDSVKAETKAEQPVENAQEGKQ